MMNLKEQLQKVEKWHRIEQIQFCEKIVKRLYISIRSVWSDDSLTCETKLEAIKWINEFIHNIDNFKFKLNWALLSENIDVFEIGRHAKFYADLNETAGSEIGAIITSAYESTKTIDPISILKGGDNLFELLKSEAFRKRPTMYIGKATLSHLRSFMAGYHFSQYMHKFSLTQQEEQFSYFHDWVATHYGWSSSTAGWEGIILQECQGNEEKALKTFFELYDTFYATISI